MNNEQIIAVSGLCFSLFIMIILIIIYIITKKKRSYIKSDLTGNSNTDGVWNFFKNNIFFFSILFVLVIVITFMAVTIQSF